MQTIPMHISEGSTKIRLTPEQLRVVGAVSPTVDATRVDDGVEITIHDLRGTKTVELYDGERGPQGIQGIQGPKGEKGDTGPQGLQGIQGLKGDKGDTGPQGPQGIQGPEGDKGDTGPQGPQGIQGPKGDKGDTGNAFYIVKTYPSISEMNADYFGSDVKIGEFVLIASNVEDPDNAKVFVKGDQQYNFIVDLSGSEGIKGPKGDKGDKGDTGETGPQGEKGETGPQGPQGIQGPKGNTGETGPQGVQGIQGEKGDKGDTGDTGPQGIQGPKGDTGNTGSDGISPTITVTDITGGHRVTITDATGPHSFDVLDAPDAPVQSVNGQTGAVVLDAADVGAGTYSKPAGGIPASDLAEGAVPVQDVQVNGTSVVTDGVANVPLGTNSSYGVLKTPSAGGMFTENGSLYINSATVAHVKAGNQGFWPLTPSRQHEAAFYGLAKVAGADMASSVNPVGTYTDAAKSAISQMLNGSVAVTGTAPVITALPGIRYVCGEVATLDITLPASGIVDVVFESGATATVLTIAPPTGVTVKWANGFDPTALEANTTYEINIADGLGVAGQWT